MEQNTATTLDLPDKKNQKNQPSKSTATSGKRRCGFGCFLKTLVLLVILGGAGFWYTEKYLRDPMHSLQQSWQTKFTSLQQQQEQQQAENQRLSSLITAQAQQLTQQQENLQLLQTQLAGLNRSDSQHWLLTQADFMLKLAGRKLWIEQDIHSVLELLKEADSSLAQTHDPSLLPIRRLIGDDISTLNALPRTDFDGIVLRLNQLANQVDNLPLAEHAANNPPMEEAPQTVTGSLRDWKQNIVRNWELFLAGFIKIRHRDTTAEPLLAPGQDIYLRENIRAQLLIAAQAVPRHQNEIYRLALETATPWIRSYFNTEDTNTQQFLAQLETLIEQSISLDLPSQFTSQPALEQAIRQRSQDLSPPTPAPAHGE